MSILSKLIEKSIDIDDKLYKRIIKKKYDGEKIGYLEFYRGGNVSKKNYRNYLL